MNLNTATILFSAVLFALPISNAFAQGDAVAVGKPGAAKEVTRTITVELLDNMRFGPDRITVRKGETIRFVVANKGVLPHELVLGSLHGLRAHAAEMRNNPHGAHDDPGAVRLDPRETKELVWKFTDVGTVDFACLLPGHFEAGMMGQVQVTKG